MQKFDFFTRPISIYSLVKRVNMKNNNKFFTQTRFDEVDEANPAKKPTIHEILLKGKRGNRLPFEDELMPPREAFIEKAEKKSWHPIVWPHPERVAPEIVMSQKELPHKRVIRNLRRLLADIADKPAERERHIENLLLILPRGSADPLKVIRPQPEKKEGEEDIDEEGEETIENTKTEEKTQEIEEDQDEEEEEEVSEEVSEEISEE